MPGADLIRALACTPTRNTLAICIGALACLLSVIQLVTTWALDDRALAGLVLGLIGLGLAIHARRRMSA